MKIGELAKLTNTDSVVAALAKATGKHGSARICMNIAGIGGFLLNVILWFSTFPPSSNPIVDGTHTIYALLLLLLMFLHAGNKWGFGRWWSSLTPRILH